MVGSPDYGFALRAFSQLCCCLCLCVTCRWAVSAEAETVWEITKNYGEGIEREGSVGHVSGIRGVEAGALKGRVGLCFGGKGRRTLLTDR